MTDGFVNAGLTTVSTSGNIWSGTTSVTLEFDVDKAYKYDGGNLLIDMSWANNPNGFYKEDPTVYWTVFDAQMLREAQIVIPKARSSPQHE